jgi:origin recognition complex subunit 4
MTDAQAFRAMAMQLSVEDELEQQRSDAFSSSSGLKHDVGASTGAHLTLLFDVLKKTGRAGRAVIFVLEDFDKFAAQSGGAANHQALLYNLLDMTHHSGMRFGVLGTSVRTDVLQLLEKRVRSRFSQVTVVMTSALQEPNNLLSIIYSRLALSDDMKDNTLRSQWNERVELLLSSRDAWCVIHSVAQRTRDVRALLHLLSVAVTYLSESDWLLRPEHLSSSFASFRSQEYSLVHHMQALTPLQTCLMGALLRLVQREFAVITFAAVVQQLREFAEISKDSYVAAAKYSDSACSQAIDELVSEGLVDYAENTACRSRTRQEYRALVMLAHPADLRQFFLLHREVSPELRDWAGRDRTSDK